MHKITKRRAKGTKNWALDRKFLTYARLDGLSNTASAPLLALFNVLGPGGLD